MEPGVGVEAAAGPRGPRRVDARPVLWGKGAFRACELEACTKGLAKWQFSRAIFGSHALRSKGDIECFQVCVANYNRG
jgi:hypothetical protein